jgi:hypothetical protein
MQNSKLCSSFLNILIVLFDMELVKLYEAISREMELATRRIVDEEAKNAAIRVEERVRGLAGEIATKVATFVTYEALRNEVRITVRLPDRDNNP